MEKKTISSHLYKKLFFGLSIIGLTFWIEYPYWDTFFNFDDFDHLAQASKFHNSQLSITSYFFAPHNEHFIPLWKVFYYFTWRLAGPNPQAWHLLISFFHGLSALILFFLTTHYLKNKVAAALIAYLWAGSAIGGWDNPLVWIAASHLSMGATFLLMAMLCLTQYSSKKTNLWAGLMGGSLLASTLTMGTYLLMTPIILLQFFLFERLNKTKLKINLLWASCWILPCLITGFLQLFYVFPEIKHISYLRDLNFLIGVKMMMIGFSVAFGNFFNPPISTHNLTTIGYVGIPALLVLIFSALSRPKTNRHFVILILALTGGFSLLSYVVRSLAPFNDVITWGRYRYFPTLAWSVCIGVIIASLSSRFKVISIILTGIILSVNIPQQASYSQKTAKKFTTSTQLSTNLFRSLSFSLKIASSSGRKKRKLVAFPDIPVLLSPTPHLLSNFAGYAFPEGLPFVTFVPPEKMSSEKQ